MYQPALFYRKLSPIPTDVKINAASVIRDFKCERINKTVRRFGKELLVCCTG